MALHSVATRHFRYEGFELDQRRSILTCRYSLDAWNFIERITFAPSDRWSHPAVEKAARLVFLLAGVSYYKAGAPPVIDVGLCHLTEVEEAFLRSFYVDGLGEYAYRNGLNLGLLRFEGAMSATAKPAAFAPPAGRPLVPFGGGIDSIVTVELVRRLFPEASLFIVSPARARFDVLERTAAAAELPVVRVEREIDPQMLRSDRLGFRNGHVPITGIISSIAVMAAVLEERDAVVMSNEWSASLGNVELDGRSVNHQFSKSLAFEAGFRRVLAESYDVAPEYFSLLRPFSELRIAKLFAPLTRYHRLFRSCNRAFHLDTIQRLDEWCGECDKCCFIDLILAPFLRAEQLTRIFHGREPLANAALAGRFRTLLGLTSDVKPFECVGDVSECRAAALLAAARPDRVGVQTLQSYAQELNPWREQVLKEAERLLGPVGPHFIPSAYATKDLLV